MKKVLNLRIVQLKRKEDMRRVITTVLMSLIAVAASAQTPEEIVSRMEEKLDKVENDAVYMICDVKVPILGTMTTYVYSYGDKSRVEATALGAKIITWEDGVTEWTYNSKTNEIEIENVKPTGDAKESEGDMSMFSTISDGYDLSITKETGEAWYIQAKKSKTNTDKDVPKTMDIVIAKGTYLPISLSAKMKGMTMTMHDMRFDVTEAQCTFNPAEFPRAKIVDKREKK